MYPKHKIISSKSVSISRRIAGPIYAETAARPRNIPQRKTDREKAATSAGHRRPLWDTTARILKVAIVKRITARPVTQGIQIRLIVDNLLLNDDTFFPPSITRYAYKDCSLSARRKLIARQRFIIWFLIL